MQRCLVQWVSSGKKPSGHPADRGMACWRDACCSRTERGASGGRGPRYRGSRWILAPSLLDRKPRCHAVPLRTCVRSALALRSREKFTYGARAATDRESTSRCWPTQLMVSLFLLFRNSTTDHVHFAAFSRETSKLEVCRSQKVHVSSVAIIDGIFNQHDQKVKNYFFQTSRFFSTEIF